MNENINIIEKFTKEDWFTKYREKYCGKFDFFLEKKHIEALQQGKWLELDINGGEYGVFIKLEE